MPVTAPILTKFKTDQWYYVQMFYTIFLPNRTKTMEIKVDIQCAGFLEAHLARKISANDLCTKFHENPTLSLVFNTRSTKELSANQKP
jgi:outer membrane protein assembly factor BamE (lipoprotein component of BamABCDE complex)